MDSDEEERLRLWKQHLASQRAAGDDDDSDDHHAHSSPDEAQQSSRRNAADPLPARRGTASSSSSRRRVPSDFARDSLTDGGAENQSIDWASTLMPQLRELQEENAGLRARAAAHEKEMRKLQHEREALSMAMGIADGGGSSDGAKLGVDMKDSKIVELAKKNRNLTVRSPPWLRFMVFVFAENKDA